MLARASGYIRGEKLLKLQLSFFLFGEFFSRERFASHFAQNVSFSEQGSKLSFVAAVEMLPKEEGAEYASSLPSP